jgi:hypothetical protein
VTEMRAGRTGMRSRVRWSIRDLRRLAVFDAALMSSRRTGEVQLADVAPGIGAQVRPEGGGGTDPVEQRLHRAVPQEVHVIDRIGPGGHAAGQACDLRGGVDAAGPGGPHAREQIRQSRAAGEGHQRGEAGVRQQVRVIEYGARFIKAVRQSHLSGALSARVVEASATPILPGQRALFH